jgi:hypothetical protein
MPFDSLWPPMPFVAYSEPSASRIFAVMNIQGIRLPPPASRCPAATVDDTISEMAQPRVDREAQRHDCHHPTRSDVCASDRRPEEIR